MKRFSCLFIIILFVIFIVVGCSPDTLLDPNDPVILTMWHVYGEQANSPMNELVDEFNSTLGRDRGIIINVTHISNAYQIGQQLKAAQKGILGASDMPDLFFCHNNNAQELGTQNLVDWNNYFSQDELAHYVDDFLEDGIVDGKLVVFPVSKSTQLLFINGTQFERFLADTGFTYDDLATWDGFFRVAAAYYDWSGGKSFCAMDYLMRAIELCMEAKGHNDYMTSEGWYDFDDAVLKGTWMEFATSLVQGHIVISDLYANTQVMTGETVAGFGSSAAILYYNDTVTYSDNTSEPMNLEVVPMPQSNLDNAIATQAGVGLCAYKTTEQKGEAAAVFARWLTESDRNLQFVTDTGYMPVTDGAFDEIESYPFEEASYKTLYVTLKKVRDTSTLVEEPIYDGYYDKIAMLYEKLRVLQHDLEERCLAGELPEVLAEETWLFFESIS